MAEIEPVESSKIMPSSNNNAVTNPKKETANKPVQNNPQGDSYVAGQSNRASTNTKVFYEDKFNPSYATKPDVSNQKAENTRPIIQLSVFNSINTARTSVQTFIAEHMARFINITDKIAAVFGEKEKDIRDRLSDTFKQMQENIFDLLAKIDASFAQKDHHKEKKARNPEEQDPEDIERIDNTAA